VSKPNPYLLIVFESCRYDTFLAAHPKTLRRLGRIERRWSYTSWTSPSHFNLLNTGETHYAYSLPHETQNSWPRIHGVHGVLGPPEGQAPGAKLQRRTPFTRKRLAELRLRQVEAVRHLDTVIEELLDLVPTNTYITVTSDHGELFGEDGYFGHGPIQHDKVFEVPFVEGRVR
jgi:membrane-anchored protein YejM (alkaline phosphatase superfamily)